MKSFREFCLAEGLIRTGAIASYSAQSRRYGDGSVRAFKSGQETLRRGSGDMDVDGRLERIERAFNKLFDGLIKQRLQIGSGVAVDVAGHMFAAKARKKR